jgi:uncharacterized protein YfcZ (UPF0381/DUF406 family)
MAEFATVDIVANVDTSALDDLPSQAEDVASKVSDSLAKIPITADASDFMSTLDEAQSKADELSGKEVSPNISADTSGLNSACDEAESKLSSLEEKASSVESMMSTMFQAIEIGVAIEAIDQVIDRMDALVGKFAELEDISTRSAMFGNTATGQIGGMTDQIMEQADLIGSKYGMSPEKVAAMEGTLRQYGTDTQKMTQDQLGQYVALARGMQQDPSAVADEVMKTADRKSVV